MLRKKISHKEKVQQLIQKKKLAQIKYAERKIKLDIIKLYLPHFHFKFNKFIVVFCIVIIILYTIAAILLQKYTTIELSPTLTTCVFAFFGTELLGLAGIKCFETKCNDTYIGNDNADIGITTQTEKADIDNDDAVG